MDHDEPTPRPAATPTGPTTAPEDEVEGRRREANRRRIFRS